VAVFIDKYLDVIFTPQGDINVDDRDELNTALQIGDISKGQYDSALKECGYIIETYCTDIAKKKLRAIKSYILFLKKSKTERSGSKTEIRIICRNYVSRYLFK